jgi:hypothetical protein
MNPPRPVPVVGYAPRALVFGTLPVRPVKPTTWTRRLGPTQVQVFGAPAHGVPYGQDRATYLLACTRAVYANSREVELGPAFGILGDLGLPPDGRNYQRLGRRLLRVFNSAMIVRQSSRDSEVRTSVLTFDRADVWCENGACRDRRFVNRVVLSADLWRELRRSFVTYPWIGVRALADSPANLDFFLWTAMRSLGVRPGGFVGVPLTGAAGLMRHLGLVYSQDRDFRAKVRIWLERVRAFAPDWPVDLAGDGQSLLVWHREPEHVGEARAFIREVRIARALRGAPVPEVAP